jgi:hypothetical protein
LSKIVRFLHEAEFAGDEVEVEGEVYCLDYRTINGDVTQPQNAFATPDFSPHGELSFI